MKFKEQIEAKVGSAQTLTESLISSMVNNAPLAKPDMVQLLQNIKSQLDYIEDRLELESQD